MVLKGLAEVLVGVKENLDVNGFSQKITVDWKFTKKGPKNCGEYLEINKMEVHQKRAKKLWVDLKFTKKRPKNCGEYPTYISKKHLKIFSRVPLCVCNQISKQTHKSVISSHID